VAPFDKLRDQLKNNRPTNQPHSLKSEAHPYFLKGRDLSLSKKKLKHTQNSYETAGGGIQTLIYENYFLGTK
jgi:hypothetical protein